jgi:asparaginyl-tRNA synthetase
LEQAICVIGKYIKTPNNKQPFEIFAEKIELTAKCDLDYRLQKKHNFEILREISHLKERTNIFKAYKSCWQLLIYGYKYFFSRN